jgi:hypothetical protein
MVVGEEKMSETDAFVVLIVYSGNTKGGSITVPLTSHLTSLD